MTMHGGVVNWCAVPEAAPAAAAAGYGGFLKEFDGAADSFFRPAVAVEMAAGWLRRVLGAVRIPGGAVSGSVGPKVYAR